jgi:transposase, IS5 family
MSSFLDLIRRSPKGNMLKEIDQLVDWGLVHRKLKRILLSHGMGRPSYDALKMFKILLLQRLYDLSDPEMEHQLYDRLSFRDFCGFSFSESLPDETTICRFRASLLTKSEPLFDVILDQLDQKGLLLRKGTMVDATIIKANCKPPQGGEQSEVDGEAGWTCKNNEYTYGYKAHIGADEGTGIVVAAQTTSADFHDSQVIHHVVTGFEEAVYADKAYDSKAIRKELQEAGIKDRILRKKPKGQKLSKWKKILNKMYSKIRCGVERVFAHWKGQHGYVQARYRGWDKNQVHLHLLCMAYNLKRAVSIMKKQRPQVNGV